jgi:hypothetical protein
MHGKLGGRAGRFFGDGLSWPKLPMFGLQMRSALKMPTYSQLVPLFFLTKVVT